MNERINMESSDNVEKGPTLVLPDNPELREKLSRKLEEYKDRLNKQIQADRYKAPESRVFADTRYKIAILERLLMNGSVDTFQIAEEFKQEEQGVFREEYQNACAVIDDYIHGRNVIGGSGLK